MSELVVELQAKYRTRTSLSCKQGTYPFYITSDQYTRKKNQVDLSIFFFFLSINKQSQLLKHSFKVNKKNPEIFITFKINKNFVYIRKDCRLFNLHITQQMTLTL